MADKSAIDILSQIDSFDGHGDANSLNFFLKSCDAMMKIVKTTEKDRLAELIFATKLKGKAQEVTQYKEFNSWEEIKDFLLENFTDKRPPSHFLNLLMNIRQNYRETIKGYGERVQTLFNKYKETCNLNYTSNEAKVLIDNLQSILVSNFRKGLHDEKIQIRIIAENTVDLDKAISIAIELELEQNDKFKIGQNSRNINLIHSNISTNPNNYKPGPSQSSCMFCHKNNHVTSQCRQLYKFEQSQVNNSNLNSYNCDRNFSSQQRNNNFGMQYNRRDNFRENTFQAPNSYGNRNNYGNNSNNPRNNQNRQNYISQNLNNENNLRQRFPINNQNFPRQQRFSNRSNFSTEENHYNQNYYPGRQENYSQNYSNQYNNPNEQRYPNQQLNSNPNVNFNPRVQTISREILNPNNSVDNSTSLAGTPRETHSGNE